MEYVEILKSAAAASVEPVLNLWQSEFSWVLLAVAGPLIWTIWRPFRYLINSWRLYRMYQKYPQRIVCASTPIKEQPSSKTSSLLPLVGSLLSAILTLPFLIIKCIMTLVTLLFQDITSLLTSEKGAHSSSNNTSETASVTSERSSTKLPSVLRRSGSSSVSVASDQRVIFCEHSNGSVKTENYYYDPHAQPGASVDATVSWTPEKNSGVMATPDQRRKIRRIQTPPPRHVILPRRIEVMAPEDKENTNNRSVDDVSTAKAGSLQKRPVITTARRLSKTDSFANTLAEYRPSLNGSTLSDQMRKRRLEGEELGLVHSKRQNHGRVALGGIRQRNSVLSSRVILSKRQREEREQQILKEMNRKRIKVSVPVLPVISASTVDTPNATDSAKPAFQFDPSAPSTAATTHAASQQAPASTPSVVAGKPDDASNPSFSFSQTAPAPTTNTASAQGSSAPGGGFQFDSKTSGADTSKTIAPSVSFGNPSTPAPAPSDPPNASFSFGGTPAAAPTPTPAAFGNTPAAAPAAGTEPPKSAFSFESTPAAAAPQNFGSAPANPVAATGGFGAPPAFGAAAPQQAPSSGASARRRAKSRGRRH